jgi:hypothetical protein
MKPVTCICRACKRVSQARRGDFNRSTRPRCSACGGSLDQARHLQTKHRAPNQPKGTEQHAERPPDSTGHKSLLTKGVAPMTPGSVADPGPGRGRCLETQGGTTLTTPPLASPNSQNNR